MSADSLRQGSIEPPHAGGVEPACTPLYAAIAAHSGALRVVCVVPEDVPQWWIRLQAAAAEHEWLQWSAIPVAGLSLAPSRAAVADLRLFLRHERYRKQHRRGAFTPVRLDGPVCPVDSSAVRARIEALRPDLVLLLGAPQWAQALAPCATRGCWVIGDNLGDADAAAQALLAPLLRGEAATAVELELASEDSPALDLVQSWGSTSHAALGHQVELVFLKLPSLLLRALRRLQQGELAWPAAAVSTLRMKAPVLSAGCGARALVHTLAARLRLRWHRARLPHEDPWFVLTRQGGAPLQPEHPDIPRFQALIAAENLGEQIWADPCIVEDGGRRLLFVEECTPDAHMAHIACIELPREGPARRLGLVLDRACHLSFPQVFRWDGQWYMTVESGQARCAVLYRAQAFPLMWQPLAELVTGRKCVDPVLHHHEGRWYLFVNVAEGGGSSWDELFLFVADTLTGPYRPHPANPIVADVRRARPAGRLFVRDGRLIRPAQDCAPSYGAAVVFNEVLMLSPTEYRERPLGRLDASWARGLDGCHTYSASGELEVLDARGRLPKDAVRQVV